MEDRGARTTAARLLRRRLVTALLGMSIRQSLEDQSNVLTTSYLN